jgi:hypothetical protein
LAGVMNVSKVLLPLCSGLASNWGQSKLVSKVSVISDVRTSKTFRDITLKRLIIAG